MGTDTPGRAVGRGEVLTVAAGTVRIRGHLQLQRARDSVRPIRLPEEAWTRFPPAMAAFRAQVIRPSGVRLSFRTDATRIVLHVACTRLRLPDVDAERNGFALHVDGEPVRFVPSPVDAHEVLSSDGVDSHIEAIRARSQVVFDDLGDGERTIDIWLPQMMIVDILDLEADRPVTALPVSADPVWVHYGSSISHGGNASSPSSTWPAVTARRANTQLINLGFAGQCHIDPFVADAIAQIDADIITLELGVNVVGSRSLDQRTFTPAVHGFLDRIRLSHPATPVVLVSALLWPGNEDVAGPGAMDFPDGQVKFRLAGSADDVTAGALSMHISRMHLEQIATARQRAGERITYLDGRKLYGDRDVQRWPLADNLHPESALSEEIGRRFAELVFPVNP